MLTGTLTQTTPNQLTLTVDRHGDTTSPLSVITDSGQTQIVITMQVPVPVAENVTVKDGPYLDLDTWGGSLDPSKPFRFKHVVSFPSMPGVKYQQINIGVTWILDGGTLELWNSLVNYFGTLTGTSGKIIFHVADDRLFLGNGTSTPSEDPALSDFYPSTDIGLWNRGTLDLRGATVTPWLLTTTPSTPPDVVLFGVQSWLYTTKILTLEWSPASWQVGDRIVVKNERGESTLTTLADIAGSVITLQNAVTFTVLFADNRWVLPAVGNLSRRLVIASADVREGDTHHRAHIVNMMGSSCNMEGVELRDLGPRGKLGRYPLHHHRCGDMTMGEMMFCGGSIWSSTSDFGSRFVAVHATRGAVICDSVMYGSQGHGVFFEDGSEVMNEATGNLVAGVRGPEELPVKYGVNSVGGPTTDPSKMVSAAYWLRTGNICHDNIAAGAPVFILPTTSKDTNLPPSVLKGFEVSGTDYGFWRGADNIELVDPVATYCAVSAITLADIQSPPMPAYGKPKNQKITNPLFLMNGFDTTKEYRGGVYLNSEHGFVMTGGLIAGEVGINIHYDSAFAIIGTKINCKLMMNQSYFSMAGDMGGCEVTISGSMFKLTNYAMQAAAPSHILTIHDCTGTTPAGLSINGRFTHYHNEALGPGVLEPYQVLRLNS